MEIVSESDAPTAGAVPSDLQDALENAGLADYLETPAAGAPARTSEERAAEREAIAARDELNGESEDVDAAIEAAEKGERTAKKTDGEEDKGTSEEQAEAALKADADELRAIKRRAHERKLSRRAAQRPAAAAARPAQAAAPAVAAKPTPSADEQAVAAAVRDVIAEIAKMTSEDEKAAANGTAATGAAADARKADLAKLQAKVDALNSGLGENAELRKKLDSVEATIKEQADRAKVNGMIDRMLDVKGDKFPALMALRNPTALIYDRAEKYFEKHGKAPNLTFVAETIEKVLARRSKGESPETPAKAGEKTPAKTRKTVSQSTATPPADRKGPDKRTKEEVEKDLFASLGIASDFQDD
jgi:hypothetical protein